MALQVNLTDVPNEILWGAQYLAKRANDIIADRNSRLPEGAQPEPLKTPEQILEELVGEECLRSYSQLVSHKEQVALAMFRSLDPQQQEALIAQFQIPDVL